MADLDLEKELTRALDRHLAAADGSAPANLAESIRYSLLAPGKRIRPRLSLACARLVGLPSAAALPAALAIEMIHCFTLIHDDLPCMDDDDFRRGRPSNHKAHGEATALLAGDALMMLALDTLTDASAHVADPGHFVRALRRFAWASGARGVIGGQAAESGLGAASGLEQLERMHAMKTGALFSASLLIPMDLAGIGAQSEQGSSIERFAAALGLAFQAADDLEDAEKEAHLPTSILYYLPAPQARSQTLQRLSSATSRLRDAWGAVAADELSAIAAEVGQSLDPSLKKNGGAP